MSGEIGVMHYHWRLRLREFGVRILIGIMFISCDAILEYWWTSVVPRIELPILGGRHWIRLNIRMPKRVRRTISYNHVSGEWWEREICPTAVHGVLRALGV